MANIAAVNNGLYSSTHDTHEPDPKVHKASAQRLWSQQKPPRASNMKKQPSHSTSAAAVKSSGGGGSGTGGGGGLFNLLTSLVRRSVSLGGVSRSRASGENGAETQVESQKVLSSVSSLQNLEDVCSKQEVSLEEEDALRHIAKRHKTMGTASEKELQSKSHAEHLYAPKETSDAQQEMLPGMFFVLEYLNIDKTSLLRKSSLVHNGQAL